MTPRATIGGLLDLEALALAEADAALGAEDEAWPDMDVAPGDDADPGDDEAPDMEDET